MEWVDALKRSDILTLIGSRDDICSKSDETTCLLLSLRPVGDRLELERCDVDRTGKGCVWRGCRKEGVLPAV